MGFEHGGKAPDNFDPMWDVHKNYMGTVGNAGPDFIKEITELEEFEIPKPQHDPEDIELHEKKERLRKEACKKALEHITNHLAHLMGELEAAKTDKQQKDLVFTIQQKILELEEQKGQKKLEQDIDYPLELKGDKALAWKAAIETYHKRVEKQQKDRVHGFHVLRGMIRESLELQLEPGTT